jgi:TonB family protein
MDQDAEKHGVHSRQVDADIGRMNDDRNWCRQHRAEWDHTCFDVGVGGVIGSDSSAPPTASTLERIRVGGRLEAASLVITVAPEYPAIARTAHVSGTVVLHAIVGKDGRIQELGYVSGPPLLMRSALDAVKQWRYKPAFLNCEAVEVSTTIAVVFSLVSVDEGPPTSH